MKRLLLILILTLSFQSWTKADQKNDLIKDANEGNAIAQNNLGFNYLYGQNGSFKFARIRKWNEVFKCKIN